MTDDDYQTFVHHRNHYLNNQKSGDGQAANYHAQKMQELCEKYEDGYDDEN